VVATPNPELEVLQKELVLLKQDNDRLHGDNEWIKSLVGTRRGWRDPDIWIAIFTCLTLCVLIWYAWETSALRKEAQKQVKAAYRQNEISVENTLRPVVVLGTRDDFAIKPNQTTITIRNIGFGPALDTVTSAVTMDHAKMPEAAIPIPRCLGGKEPLWMDAPRTAKATMHLNHRTAIAVNEIEDIDVEEKIQGGPTFRLTRETCTTEPYTRLTPVQNIEGLLTGETPKFICIAYQNAASERYETWQRIYRPSESQPLNLAIDYICQRKTPPGVRQCTELVEKACQNSGGVGQ
jgi:hypothetical protein